MNHPCGAVPPRCGGQRLGGGRRRLALPRSDLALGRPARSLVLRPVRPEARDQGGEGRDLAVGRLHHLLLDLVVAALRTVRRLMKRAVVVCLMALLLAALPAASQREKDKGAEKVITNSVAMKL